MPRATAEPFWRGGGGRGAFFSSWDGEPRFLSLDWSESRRSPFVEAPRVGLALAEVLVEDVVRPLARRALDDARLLQQRRLAPARLDGHRVPVELDAQELGEAARVAVAQRRRVAERLEERPGPEHLRDDGLRRGAVLGDVREVGEHQFHRLRLPRAGLAGHQDGLVLAARGAARRGARHRVDVRRAARLVARRRVAVERPQILRVERQPLEGVHGEDDVARGDVRPPRGAPPLDGLEDRRLVDVAQVAQILHVPQLDDLLLDHLLGRERHLHGPALDDAVDDEAADVALRRIRHGAPGPDLGPHRVLDVDLHARVCWSGCVALVARARRRERWGSPPRAAPRRGRAAARGEAPGAALGDARGAAEAPSVATRLAGARAWARRRAKMQICSVVDTGGD